MTANQLKAQENALKREELEEKKRTGKADRSNKYASGIGSALKGAGAFASLIGKVNDPSWYNLDKQLVDDVAQLPYGKPIGINEDRPAYQETLNSEAGITGLKEMPFPGIMRIEYSATVGDGSANESDAINVAMRNVYSFVRHANSGSRNYDAPDLMQYMLTMDSIYSLISHCSRAYSIALTAKSNNRYWPTKVLNAAGFITTGTDTILNNLAQFRAEINMAIQKASIFNVPGKFPYFNRHIWMNGNIFKDGEYKRCRNYVFVPNVYYPSPDINGMQYGIKYMHYNTATGTVIFSGWKDPNYTTWSDVRHMSYTDAVTLLKHLIDDATQNEDYGIMSGDILKAFGEEGVFKLQSLPEDYHIESVFSPEVLTQIQGANILQGTYEGAFIGQTANGIIYQGSKTVDLIGGTTNLVDTAGIIGILHKSANTSLNASGGTSKILLNMYKDAVTPDDNMVATRLSSISKMSTTNLTVNFVDAGGTNTPDYVNYSQVLSCASEVVDAVVIFSNGTSTFNSSANNYRNLQALFSDDGLRINGYGVQVSIGSTSKEEVFRVIQTINGFEWAPRIFVGATNNSITNPNLYVGGVLPLYDNMELANYIFIGKDILDKMHAVALLSLFAVPLLGNTARKF